MQIDTGVSGAEAIAAISRRQGISEADVLKREIRAHRALSRRGALYRADIMGTGGTSGQRKNFTAARYNTNKRRMVCA